VTVREYGWLSRNPVSLVTRLEDSKGRERFLTEDERKALLEACDASSFGALSPIVNLALATGARKSELLNLLWNGVDLQRRIVRFLDTKNGESRTVPLAATAVATLKAWRKARLPIGAVFPKRRSGHLREDRMQRNRRTQDGARHARRRAIARASRCGATGP